MGKDYPSSIDKLPLEIQQAILDKRARGATIDQVLAAIRALDPAAEEISRTALGRHIKSEATIIQQMRLTNSIGAAVAEQMGDQPDDRLARANRELLKGHIMRLVTATDTDEQGNEVQRQLTTKEIKELSTSQRDIEQGKKLDAEWRAKVRQEAALEAAKAVKNVARDGGISADVAQKLWDAVMGTVATK